MDTSISNTDNLILGHKVIGYALNLLAWGTAMAVAWSCSTLLMGIVMFIIMAIVMALLTSLVHVVLMFKLPSASVESIGSAVGSVTGRVSALFTRKAPAAAV
jgi:hypothetical protein